MFPAAAPRLSRSVAALVALFCGAAGSGFVAGGCSFLAPSDDELLGGRRPDAAPSGETGGETSQGGSGGNGIGDPGSGGAASTSPPTASDSGTAGSGSLADACAGSCTPEPADACADDECTPPVTPPVVNEPKPTTAWLRHDFECNGTSSQDSCKTKPACAHDFSVSETRTVIGKTGVSYNMTLRFRGVLEPKAYGGGKTVALESFKANVPTSPLYEGGAASGDAIYNTYSLQISSPNKTYFLNAAPEAEMVIGFDYTATFKIAAGANVTFYAFSKNCAISYDCADLSKAPSCTPTTIPNDLPHLASKGQFLQIDIVKVSLAATTPATTAVDL